MEVSGPWLGSFPSPLPQAPIEWEAGWPPDLEFDAVEKRDIFCLIQESNHNFSVTQHIVVSVH